MAAKRKRSHRSPDGNTSIPKRFVGDSFQVDSVSTSSRLVESSHENQHRGKVFLQPSTIHRSRLNNSWCRSSKVTRKFIGHQSSVANRSRLSFDEARKIEGNKTVSEITSFNTNSCISTRAAQNGHRRPVHCSSSASSPIPSSSTLASEPDPSSSLESFHFDLGASGSKRRRRDRHRSVVCQPDNELVTDAKSAGFVRGTGERISLPSNADTGLSFPILGQSPSTVTAMLPDNAEFVKSQSFTAHPTFHDLRSRHHSTQRTPTSLYLLPSSVQPLNSVDPEQTHGSYSSSERDSHAFRVQAVNSLQVDPGHLYYSVPADVTLSSYSPTHPFPPMIPSLPDTGPVGSQNSAAVSYMSDTGFTLRDVNLISSFIGQSSVAEVINSLNYTLPSVAGNANMSHQYGSAADSFTCPRENSTVSSSNLPQHVLLPTAMGSGQGSVDPHQSLLNHVSHVARFISLNPSSISGRSSRTAAAAVAAAAATAVTTGLSDSRPTYGMPPPMSLPNPPSTNGKYSRTSSVNNADTLRSSANGFRGSTSHAGGRHSPHMSGINHRISQLRHNQHDRSMQLVILQDINQILLMGFEENLVTLNSHGLVSCVMDILDSDEEHLVDLKNLGCNVLTHMMDVLPRTSEAVIPALPVLLTTMSCSFVGDILERVINLLEQLSRRHGHEVLQSGAIASVLGFYDFVTLTQHRTILIMVANCLVSLQPSEFDLIADCLPSLAERLKESDSRCVERVCTCFARLVMAYQSQPNVLRRIVSSCDLFSNLQHLLMVSPPILSNVRDVVQVLATLCSASPCLAVDLIKKNISATLHCLLTGEAIDSHVLQYFLLQLPLSTSSSQLLCYHPAVKRQRSHSGSDRKRGTTGGSKSTPTRSESISLWPPLMLTISPMPDTPTVPSCLSINKRSQEDIHAILQLICELLPRIPPAHMLSLLSYSGLSSPTKSPLLSTLVYCDLPYSWSFLLTSILTADPHQTACRLSGDRVPANKSLDPRRRSESNLSYKLSIPLNQLALDDQKVNTSSSSGSCSSSGTLRHSAGSVLDDNHMDPRSRLLQEECCDLQRRLEAVNSTNNNPLESSLATRRRSSVRHHHPPLDQAEIPSAHSTQSKSVQDVTADTISCSSQGGMEALQTVQTILPLLFELFTETTRVQTRLTCLEAIQRMLFYSSPVLLAKILRPRIVCNHIVGMLNCPDQRVVLCGLIISLLLINRIPPMFVTYFRKEGILHQVDLLKAGLSGSDTSPPEDLPFDEWVPTDVSSVLSPYVRPSDVTTDSTAEHTSALTRSVTLKHADFSRLFSSTSHVNELPDSSRYREKRGASTSSAPVMFASVNCLRETCRLPDLLSHWVRSACHQFQERVSSLLTQCPSSAQGSPSASSTGMGSRLDPSVGISETYQQGNDIDLMPKLAAVASHLNSNRPALWVFAFGQLIGLLRPSRHSASSPTEPPSPFELQKSGVTSALLHYLTERDSHDTRIWILYRMFFGSRAVSDCRLLPPPNFSNANKKTGVYKTWPPLFYDSPVLLNLQRADHLREVDYFVDRQLECDPGGTLNGPSAFVALIHCLLAYFHRHEHFQVASLPPLLVPGNRWLPFIQGMDISKTSEPNDLQPNSSSCRLSQSKASHLLSPASSRIRHHQNHSTKSIAFKASSPSDHCPPVSSGSIEYTAEVPVPQSVNPNERHPIPATSPTPGVVWIDLVRLPSESKDQSSGCLRKSDSSRHSSTNFAKSTRKSSMSSASSNSSSLSSSGCSSQFRVPERFYLQTTALATFQLIERLLLQRNYVNSLIHDGHWPLDNDYGLTSISEAHSHSSSREDLQELSVVHVGRDHDYSETVPKAFVSERSQESLRSSAGSKRSQLVSKSSRSHGSLNVSHCTDPDGSHKSDSSRSKNSTNVGSHLPRFQCTPHTVADPRLAFLASFSACHGGILRNVLPASDSHSATLLNGTKSAKLLDCDPFNRGLCNLLQQGSDTGPDASHRNQSKSSGTSGVRRRCVGRSNGSSNPNRSGSVTFVSPNRGTDLHPGNDEALDCLSFGLSEPARANLTFSTMESQLINDTAYDLLSSDTVVISDQGSQQPLSSRRSNCTRRRRLKGGSILAAFGALSNFTSPVPYPQVVGSGQTTKHTKSGSRSCIPISSHPTRLSSDHDSKVAPISPSASTSSSSSMSPNSTDGCSPYRGKHRVRLSFYVGGHQIPPNLSIFEAIRRFSPEFNRRMRELQAYAKQLTVKGNDSFVGLSTLSECDLDDLAGHIMWSTTHIIHYRLVTVPPTSNPPSSVMNLRKSDLPRVFTSNSKIPGSSSGKSPDTFGSVSVSGFTSSMSCLKRRRSDDVGQTSADVANVSTESEAFGTLQQSPYSQFSSNAQSVSHPLFSLLTRQLPRGFLNEVRCSCDTICQLGGSRHSEFQLNGTEHLLDETTSHTLSLLRILYAFSRLWYTLHDVLDSFPIVSPLTFRSPKLAVKATRQLQDVFSVLAGNLPSWLTQLVSTCPFLFPFEVRRAFFYAYDFDRERALQRIQDTIPSSLSELEQQITKSSRHNSTSASNGLSDAHSLAATTSPNSVGSSNRGSDFSTSPLSGSALSSLVSNQWSTAPSVNESTSSFTTVALNLPRPDAHAQLSRNRLHTHLALTPNLKRHKVTVHRDGKRLLRQAEATLVEMADSRAILEIAFEGEVGFGLGPTLEFYTLVSRQLMKSSLGLWHGTENTDDGYHVSPAPGLYPRALPKHTRSALAREVRSRFTFLGRLMARALLDWRQLDLPFSPAFFKWFLAPTPAQAITEGHILPNDLALVDPELARHIRQLTEMANRRLALHRQLDQTLTTGYPQTFKPVVHGSHASRAAGAPRNQASRGADEAKAALMVLDNEIEDLCLNFVLPGYDIELLKNGTHVSVTGGNLGEYIRLVAHWLVIEGASRQMEAVLDGFDSVLPNIRRRLSLLFQPDEMEGLFCGRSSSQFETLWLTNVERPIDSEGSVAEGWDVTSLSEACRCDHGYTLQSRTIRNLLEVMSEFNTEERRLFVQFVTGSPRLPVGGFRALKPPLKIVMKRESGDNADNHLPSVMTCQNYLKLPDYSSKELLHAKLLYAIREGQNAFHLS